YANWRISYAKRGGRGRPKTPRSLRVETASGGGGARMGQDVHELLWGESSRPPRGRPAGLSRERIVAEAVAVADAEGLQKVSMKRVAERLDCGVMSLYR